MRLSFAQWTRSAPRSDTPASAMSNTQMTIYDKSLAAKKLGSSAPRPKLYDDLERYRTMRDLAHDEPTIEAFEIMIRETEEHLAQLEQSRADRPGLSAEPGEAITPQSAQRDNHRHHTVN
jgi:hypothetical protein